VTSLPADSLHAHAFLRPMFAVLKEGVMGGGEGGGGGGGVPHESIANWGG
jgi:hypothetical protein